MDVIKCILNSEVVFNVLGLNRNTTSELKIYTLLHIQIAFAWRSFEPPDIQLPSIYRVNISNGTNVTFSCLCHERLDLLHTQRPVEHRFGDSRANFSSDRCSFKKSAPSKISLPSSPVNHHYLAEHDTHGISLVTKCTSKSVIFSYLCQIWSSSYLLSGNCD